MNVKTRNQFAVLSLLALGQSYAASVSLWTTTFVDNSSGANTNRAMVNTPAAPFGDTLSGTWSLARSGAASPIFLTGPSNGANNFNPRQNVDNAVGAFWEADFSFSGGSSMIDLQGITFDVYRYNNAGGMQAADAILRTVNFSAAYTMDGATWLPMGLIQNINTTASNITDSPANLYIPISFELASISSIDLATADFRVRLRVENDDSNAGANIGINSFTVTTIPEPSTSLLGGIALLALLRRRR